MKKKRLLAIVDWIHPDDSVLDVGTDHAYLPILLKQRYPDMKVGASDLRVEPLNSARNNLTEAGIRDVKLYCCDGLLGVHEQYSVVVIAGMSAKTIIHIIEEGCAYFKQDIRLIFCAHRGEPELRDYLFNHGWMITNETIVWDKKYYEIMEACRTHQDLSYTKEDIQFGPILRRERSPLFIAKWKETAAKLVTISNSLPADHPDAAALKEKISAIQKQLAG